MRPCAIRAVLFVLLSGLFPSAAAEELSEQRVQELKRLLHQDCGSCHGLALDGGLGPALSPERMQAYNREALTRLILEGVPGTAMPAWQSQLSRREARWLAEHLQSRDPARQ